MLNEHKKSNRLVNEKSPYLLQHASNPVDWYPWGNEAFEKAFREEKPIFLSIGYSTCHWCHVMERESFEDTETAELMNRVFISIKVDREERPDIDNIYMTVCQMITGSGGWPLSIVMTHDKKPFFAGTYFPKESRHGRAGFKDLIKSINDAWRSKREIIESSAVEITNHLNNSYSSGSIKELDISIIDDAYHNFENKFDLHNGGFGTAPKFPSPHNLMFLLRYWKMTGAQKPLEMVAKTLIEMRRGGIFDQIGFGFHRYSTDEKWLVPHFEKMLYDQALLITAYTEAYQATANNEFKKTVDEIATYVLRDMTAPAGGFYSAEDADSEGIEGKFYLWTHDELTNCLGKDDSEFISKIFKTREDGNFHDESTRQHSGTNILNLTGPAASELNNDERIEKIRRKLFERREKRIHPFKDEKILTDWNGLMISALAKAGRVFGNEKYIAAAESAITFINDSLTAQNGRLIHSYRNGPSSISSNIDDYAFIVWALLELHETTFKKSYLDRAIQLTEISIKHFWDETNGGFFFSPDYGEQLIARTKEYYDGAVPSGNSVFAMNLIRLSKITADHKYEDFAAKIFASASSSALNSPQSFAQLLSALNFAIGPAYEIIIAGSFSDDKTRAILSKLSQRFIPNKVIILVDSSEPGLKLDYDYLNSYSAIDSSPAIYICKNFACNLPTADVEEALKQFE